MDDEMVQKAEGKKMFQDEWSDITSFSVVRISLREEILWKKDYKKIQLRY